MTHRNAPLTPEGRRRLCGRVDAGRAICHVATEAGIARKTLGYWYARWVAEGEAGLQDRSSRPHRSPNQTPPEVEDRVVALRREHKEGPVQLVARLAEEDITIPVSTIWRILVRADSTSATPRLVSVDLVTVPSNRAAQVLSVRSFGNRRSHPAVAAARREALLAQVDAEIAEAKAVLAADYAPTTKSEVRRFLRSL